MTRVIKAPAELASLLVESEALSNEIATLEEQVREKKEQLRNTQDNLLGEAVTPDMMADDTLVQFGEDFYTFERQHHCGVNNADKPAAHQWLEEHGHGQLLKRYVTISLGKDSQAALARIKKLLETLLPHFEFSITLPARGDQSLKAFAEYVAAEAGVLKPEVEVTTELPGPTLSSWTKKMLKAGTNVPTFFGAFTTLKTERQPAPSQIDIWCAVDGKWYHRDESDGGQHGPFDDFGEAEDHLKDYCEWLDFGPRCNNCNAREKKHLGDEKKCPDVDNVFEVQPDEVVL